MMSLLNLQERSHNNLHQEALQELALREFSRRNLFNFTKYTLPTFKSSFFHEAYYRILNMFAEGKIKKLMVTVPPQHGKSEGSSRRLPAYMLGVNPNLKIGLASYNQTFVRRFSREIQRIINSQEYKNLFPNTRLPTHSDFSYTKTVDQFDIPGGDGFIKFVGRGGPLTGSPIRIMIMDDLYKDYAEGNSPVIRENVIDWYVSVVLKRLHNDSQQLIVFTRWHEDDLIGYLEKKDEVIPITNWKQLEKPKPFSWYKVNFQAIKENETSEIDPRKKNEVLWNEEHSWEKLQKERELDSEKFESMNQGNPKPKKGLLYKKFEVYEHLPKQIRLKKIYCDVADQGSDFLCSIVYVIGADRNIYVTDVYYSREAMEITEEDVAAQIFKNKVHEGDFESNSGGRGFSRAVERILREKYQYKNIRINAFHQSDNKEARIISNSNNVQKFVLFPYRWITMYPLFANDLLRFRKKFKANAHDDGPDALTGVWEKSEIYVDGSYNALYDL